MKTKCGIFCDDWVGKGMAGAEDEERKAGGGKGFFAVRHAQNGGKHGVGGSGRDWFFAGFMDRGSIHGIRFEGWAG